MKPLKQKRAAKRKAVSTVSISNLIATETYAAIARWGHLVDVSATGFLIQIDRQDLIPQHLRQNLSLGEIEGSPITLMIDPMELEIEGHIARTKYVGKGLFEIAVDFSADAPEYWRECLFDLLPGKNERLYTEEE